MALKEKQLAAMEAEQYEECALLRDVMKLLEEGLQAADAPVASKSRPSDESAPPRDPPEALEGELNTFERLAKPLLPDGATPKKRRGRTSQRRGSPGRTRSSSCSTRWRVGGPAVAGPSFVSAAQRPRKVTM